MDDATQPTPTHSAIGYMRWSLRVNANLLLMTNQYPPFSLD